MTTTISLPLAVWGIEYKSFIDAWWDGVKSLNVVPDEIVLVSDLEDSSELFSSIPDWCEIPVKTIYASCDDFSDYWNVAIYNCSSEWFSICNVDDVYLPGALDTIADADLLSKNLLIDSLIVKHTNETWSGSWQPDVIPYQFTMPGAEPMRKDLFIAAGGYRRGFRFPDWALAVDIVHKGLAKPYISNTKRIVFDTGVDRVTMSGNLLSADLKNAGNAQIHNLSRTLGLMP